MSLHHNRPFGQLSQRTLNLLLALAITAFVTAAWARLVAWNDVPPIVVAGATSATTYPTVVAILAKADESLKAGLKPGDVIQQIGPYSTEGMSRLEFRVHAFAAFDREQRGWLIIREREKQVVSDFLSTGAGRTRAEMVSGSSLIVSGLCLLFALLITWRSTAGAVGRPQVLATLTCFCIDYAARVFSGGESLTLNWLIQAFSFVRLPLLFVAGYVFLFALIDALAGHRPRLRYWFLPMAVYYGVGVPLLVAGPPNWWAYRDLFSGIGNTLLAMALAGVLWRAVPSATPRGRRRLKWLLFGLSVTVTSNVSYGLIQAFGINFNDVWIASYYVIATVPALLGLLIAIVRDGLFDIDRLISATAAYAVLGFLAVAGILLIVPELAQAASSITGLPDSTMHTAFSIATAGLAILSRERLRGLIDSWFFAERQRLAEGFDGLVNQIADSAQSDDAFALVGRGLSDLIQPDTCVVFVAREDTLAAVFTAGLSTVTNLPISGPFGHALKTRTKAITVSDLKAAEIPISDFERNALADMGAEILIPISVQGRLYALIVLGAKRSGDVYINTDLAMLTAVGRALSGEVQRMDLSVLRAQDQEKQAAMRQYVPSAVVQQLERGQAMAAETREVTVLFVDIRGYTQLSETRTADEIFQFINHYTETVSAVIRQFGGSVVEFHGDGLMAVFGAPERLWDKERRAVAAARTIIPRVRSMRLPTPDGGSVALDAGIGIATGSAYVGNIRSADRVIWGAIGNTTNLAARLQGLTKTYASAIVMDAATYAAADVEAGRFAMHSHVVIRGRTDPQTIYVATNQAATEHESDFMAAPASA